MPKRRASLSRTTVPSSRVKTTWSCLASAPLVSPAMIRPDMPRCSSKSPVSSSSIRMYLPRRPRAPISAPSSRSASIGGNGRRRSGRRNSARTMRRPVMRRARPRRTVSTSGNSGIGSRSDKVRFGAVMAREYGRDYASCRMDEPETRDEAARGNDGRDTDFGSRRVPESEKAPLVRAIFDSVAPRSALMNDLMSGGIHRLWKTEMIAWLNPRPGQRLVDVAGGTGDIACRALPKLKPETGGQVIVCDATFEMLETGRARAIDDGILGGIEWLCGDAEVLPLADRSADLYTIAFGLRNVTRIERDRVEIGRAHV